MSAMRKLAQLRQTILIGLFVMIIVVAHPIGPLGPLAYLFWTPLHATGLNVFIKPFTSDMVFMYDSELQQTMYRYQLSVTYYGETGPREIAVSELSFHRWRIPFTWLGVAAKLHEDPSPYVETLCRELQRSYGPGSGFRINSDAPADVSRKYGLNKKLTCHE
ncbi:MAG: hypothetical protein KC897_08360 [Candidatus Omnitrophica bacterium]|nr:hypothetical protein [Candidatus Omnitrophota bacterium]MCB9720380.1 hypothetical protein [Candidatus Omnitrophota bacterium]